MDEIRITNISSLEDLIDENIVRKILPIPANNPAVRALGLSDEAQREILEAVEFVKDRESQAQGNRFAQKDLNNDKTLAEARQIVVNFIALAQESYDLAGEKIIAEYAMKEKFYKDLNTLIHAKKIQAAITLLKDATKQLFERMEAVGGTEISGKYNQDDVSFFALAAVQRLHGKE